MAAYFEFKQQAPDGTDNSFIFKVVDPGRIAEAREIIAKNLGRHVQGTVVAARQPYNPNWSFYLEPKTIAFFEMAIEVCDANVTLVEAQLDEVGGAFLPGAHWCPWSSVITREVTDEIDPQTERRK